MSLGSAIRHYLMDETGAASVEFVVVVGGSMLMGYTVVTDVSRSALSVADNITLALEDIAEVHLMMNDSPNNMPADTETNEDTGTSPSSSSSSSSGTSSSGNPGNDKDVGNAGENPNGKGGWGSGSRGRSD